MRTYVHWCLFKYFPSVHYANAFNVLNFFKSAPEENCSCCAADSSCLPQTFYVIVCVPPPGNMWGMFQRLNFLTHLQLCSSPAKLCLPVFCKSNNNESSCLVSWLVVLLPGCLAIWLPYCLVVWLSGLLASCFVTRLSSYLAALLSSCLVSWQVVLLPGCLAIWLPCCLVV